MTQQISDQEMLPIHLQVEVAICVSVEPNYDPYICHPAHNQQIFLLVLESIHPYYSHPFLIFYKSTPHPIEAV
jgi:hypothetical protein